MGYSSFYNANITASARTTNILTGDINEFLTQDSHIQVFAVSSAIGIKFTMTADNEVQVDRKEITAIGTTLNKSDHLIYDEYFPTGTRLAMYLDETAGVGTTDIYTAVQVDNI